MAHAPAYQEASMRSADVADREQLEQATSLLMASLRESRALITALREASERRGQAEAEKRPEPADQSSGDVFAILRDVIDGASRR
jgi:hypothetical protein